MCVFHTSKSFFFYSYSADRARLSALATIDALTGIPLNIGFFKLKRKCWTHRYTCTTIDALAAVNDNCHNSISINMFKRFKFQNGLLMYYCSNTISKLKYKEVISE